MEKICRFSNILLYSEIIKSFLIPYLVSFLKDLWILKTFLYHRYNVIWEGEISIFGSKIASLKSILHPNPQWLSLVHGRLSLRHVSEPLLALLPTPPPSHTTLCPYYSHVLLFGVVVVESKSPFARLQYIELENRRRTARQPVTAGYYWSKYSAHHLTACCPQLPWRIDHNSDHSNF